MRWIPWVSREMHEAVCSEKERTIELLRAQIVALEARLAAPVNVTVELPKNFAVAQPAVVQDLRRKKDRGPRPGDLVPVDLSEVDENDAEAIAKIAASKFGRRAVNTWELNTWVNSVKSDIRAAKAKKQRDIMVRNEQPARAPEGNEDESTAAPQHILDLISEAERVQ